MLQFDVETPSRWASRILEVYHNRHGVLKGIMRGANEDLQRRSINYGGLKQLSFVLTPFVVLQSDLDCLFKNVRILHRVVENILERVSEDHYFIQNVFGVHDQYRPFLRKHGKHWQVISRYDFLIDPQGRIRFIELNTSCPAGYFYQSVFDDIFSACSPIPIESLKAQPAFHSESFYTDKINGYAASGGCDKRQENSDGMIAILYDENKLMIELDLIAEAFKRNHERTGNVGIMDASSLRFDGNQLRSEEGKPIRLTVNKFRVNGQGLHRWTPGFEKRYGALLTAIQRDSIITCNNFGGMVFAEDKAILAAMREKAVTQLLSAEERALIDEMVADTWIAVDKIGQRELFEKLIEHPDEYVLKPRNDGRGQGVVIGRFREKSEWERDVLNAFENNYVIQQYADTLSFPVVSMQHEKVISSMMYHTGAVFVFDGEPAGIMSRVSLNPVTNVGIEGFFQPVFVE